MFHSWPSELRPCPAAKVSLPGNGGTEAVLSCFILVTSRLEVTGIMRHALLKVSESGTATLGVARNVPYK